MFINVKKFKEKVQKKDQKVQKTHVVTLKMFNFSTELNPQTNPTKCSCEATFVIRSQKK